MSWVKGTEVSSVAGRRGGRGGAPQPHDEDSILWEPGPLGCELHQRFSVLFRFFPLKQGKMARGRWRARGVVLLPLRGKVEPAELGTSLPPGPFGSD